MGIVILGFAIILLSLYGSKAYMMHKGYKNELYSALFGSYLEYFFRNAIRKDCSTSSLLKSELGTNRMSFTTFQDREHKVTSRFVVIFYNKGIACISYLNPAGSLKGKADDKHWIINRGDKKYKIQNPMIECKKYADYFRKKFPELHVQEYIACTNDTNVDKVNTSIYYYKDMIDILKNINLPYISENEVVNNYIKFINKEV